MHRSWTLVVCLSLFLHAIVAPAHALAAGGAGDGPDAAAEEPGSEAVDQVAIDYLQLISEVMDEETDEWDERWQDGQFNVLPASMMSQGFADTVHCFEPEPEDPNGKSVTSRCTGSRTIFSFNGLF